MVTKLILLMVFQVAKLLLFPTIFFLKISINMF